MSRMKTLKSGVLALLLTAVVISGQAFLAVAQNTPPELASWLINTTGLKGYGGLPANVQSVQFSDGNVYVSSSGIPAYTIGPWPGDPNVPQDQKWVFRIPRNPQVNLGSKTNTPLGPIAVLINGVALFNALDGHSYLNLGVWHQNAVVVEAPSFDSCLGHSAPGGVYHHHQNPRCLYQLNPTSHSPLLGFAFDGFPIYGPYGYANSNGTGGIRRLLSSYRLRNITQRTTLPDGTQLNPSQYGPPVSTTYPLGYYVEDYEYVLGMGDLDEHNGRFAVTPEYPNGTYAYYVTINEDGSSAYPYIVGPTYNGVVAMEDIGPNGGHVTISEPVMTYVPSTSVAEFNYPELTIWISGLVLAFSLVYGRIKATEGNEEWKRKRRGSCRG